MTKPHFFRRPVLAALCLTVLGLALYAAPDFNSEGKRWWSHIQFLASDDLEGRQTGSAGHLKAAHYVAGEFERLGLEPAAPGYLQPVAFEVASIDEDHSSVALVRDGRATPLQLGEDAIISLRGDIVDGPTNAPAVFAGYGLHVPETGYNDLQGLDLHGKIAVILAGGPASIPGPLKAHYSSQGERWKALHAAGAIGLATIQDPKAMDIPWSREALSRFQPSMHLSDPTLMEAPGLRFALTINPARASRWFEGSGHDFAEILADSYEHNPMPRFPLAVAVRANVSLKRSKAESQNIAGILPGADPKLKSEYVVLSAHIDHVGVGQPIGGDAIYNGAMDDASGVASILEIARLIHDAGSKPKRSLLFLAVTGEEKGLQGSKYFAAHPLVPRHDIVADINLDMFLPLHALHYLEVQGLAESSLGDDIRAVAQEAGIEVQSDKEPQRNLFIRSDQYSFIRQGIPSLAFKFGYLPNSPEEKLHKEWLKNRYHAPSDDLNQPVDKDAAAQFDRVILRLVERVASAPQRPQWKPDSFFRRFGSS